MAIKESFAEVAARLKAAGVSVSAVCRAAGVARSNPTRWQSGKGAHVETWERFTAAADALIEAAQGAK